METWIYTLPDGGTGTIEAWDDDDAWIGVFRQMGQCPESVMLEWVMDPEADSRGQA